MTTTEQTIVEAERQCRTRGARLTKKRKQVLAALIDSQKALSAYELIDFCQQYCDLKISPMSIYRILAFLEREDMVHKLSSTNKYVVCAHINCGHSHQASQFLICRQCNQVKEIAVNPSMIDELGDNVEQAGFHLVSPQLEMHCLCHDCYTPSV